MKKAITLLFLCACFLHGAGQFTPMPLDYPNNGSAYKSEFLSVVDANTVWVGTIRQGTNGYLPYAEAVRTTDGGNTWQFLPIPATGTPWIQHCAAWSADVAYYLFTDGQVGGGSIWKTTDGGTSWTKKTTTQFGGGWANFIHLFSQDTILAMGDPIASCFEIELSYNGGDTWTRVPATDMPVALSGEYGVSGEYSAVDHSIWFGTSRGRVFRSTDRGLHWTATAVVPPSTAQQYVCFSDQMNGFCYQQGAVQEYFMTTDGGLTWTPKYLNPGYFTGTMTRIPGIWHGLVWSFWKAQGGDSLSVIYSTDFFNSFTILDSNIRNTSGRTCFISNTVGWLSGSYIYFHNIYKFTGTLTGIRQDIPDKSGLSVSPNPAKGSATVRVTTPCEPGRSLIRVTDLCGKEKQTLPLLPGQTSARLDAGSFPPGIYLVQLVSDGQVVAVTKWSVVR